MKQRKIVVAVIVFFVLNLTSSPVRLSAQSSPATEERGRVSGIVFDVNDARVTSAKVTFKARNFSREVFTRDAGQFNIDLPAGEYYLTVEANGFCRFEGESLKIKPGTTEMINVHLEVADYDSRDPCKCSSRKVRR